MLALLIQTFLRLKPHFLYYMLQWLFSPGKSIFYEQATKNFLQVGTIFLLHKNHEKPVLSQECHMNHILRSYAMDTYDFNLPL